MADYTIKELATTFGCSKQSIFNYIDELKKQGFTSKRGNQILVNEAGFNYIREKKQSSGRVTPKQETNIKKAESEHINEAWFYKLQNETLEQQIDELKKEKEYFRKLAEDKDNYIKHLQEQLVEVSLKALQIGLPQGQEQESGKANSEKVEQKKEETTEKAEQKNEEESQPTAKKSFLSRLFSKN